MRELLLSDDEDAARHAAIPLEEAFYVQPRVRPPPHARAHTTSDRSENDLKRSENLNLSQGWISKGQNLALTGLSSPACLMCAISARQRGWPYRILVVW